MSKGTVPAAPFVEILAGRLVQLERAEEEAPILALAQEAGLTRKLVYLLLSGRQERIAFDNADRIVTNLVGPMAWHADPTLSEIYDSADLGYADRRWPVAQVVAA